MMMNSITLLLGVTLLYSTPMVFGALGGVLSERSGVVNIGIEGMMTFGAFAGAAAGYYSGNPWIGVLCAALAGGILALLHAVAAITCQADQTISGVAINLLGPALAVFFCRLAFDGATMSYPVANKLPKNFGSGAEDIWANLNVDIMVIVALLFAVAMWFVLYRTKWGMRILAVGENPAAADTLGINVNKTRYICVILSGILAGIGSIRLLLPVVSEHFGSISTSGVPMELAVSVSALTGAAAVSLVTILISAWIPARKAACIPVLECIRQTNEIRTEGKAVRVPKRIWKLYGLEGALALKNFKRNKKRYRGVILSLTFSMVLTMCGSAFNTTLKTLMKELTAEGADGDLSFVTANMSDEEFAGLYERLSRTEGVRKSTWQANPVYSAVTEELPEDFLKPYREAMGDDSTGRTQQVPLYTQFIEDDLYYEFLKTLGFSREEYEGPDAKVLMCAVDSREHVTWCTGSTMTFTLRSTSGAQDKTVRASFVDNYPLDTTFENVPDWFFVMTVPMEMRDRFTEVEPLGGDVQKGMLFWTDTPSQTLARLQDTVMEQGIMADYFFYNLASAFDLFRNAGFVINVFMYVFVLMISLIAVANVFNTISTNIRLRRRELAMLRSVGMSDLSFNRMMRFECIFYGMRTLMYGVPLSGILSFLIYRALMSVERMEGMYFKFPWGALAVSVLGVFGIVFVTMIYATGRIRRENIIDALQDEMA